MVSILGVPIADMTEQEVLEQGIGYLHGDKPRVIITAGPEFVMQLVRDPRLRRLVDEADLVTPDGVGIVLAANWYKTPVPERVTGVELAYGLLAYAAKAHLRVYLLGATQDALQEALAKLGRQYPDLRIAGRDGYFSADQTADVVQEIRAFAPHLLLVGLGQPRQDLFIADHRAALGVPLSMGIGGTIDVIAGKVKRAPRFIQKAHMEWLYRLLKEPRRLRRQLVLPQFAWLAWRDARRPRAW